jgi:uncharacterized membrane protein
VIATTRFRYIDWARGVAVLLMIEAHTVDAWTRAADRSSLAFRDLTILGGLAAPLFLWLAGLAVVLSATRTAQKTGSRATAVDTICRRGLEIFILAFLFRLQAFVVSPGSHPITLFRVDILNVMGPGIAAAGIVWGLTRSTATRVVAYATGATAVAVATPFVRASFLVNEMPTWLQWYVRPSGEYTTFTLLPWAGFVFAGGAVGALVAAVRDERSMRRLLAWIAVAGAALVAIGFYTAAQPALFPHASFWSSSPTFFAIRVGVLMLALAALFAIEDWRRVRSQAPPAFAVSRPPQAGWLARLGGSSLFVYWIHVELVYGYATWPIHGRLPLALTLVAYSIFCVLMYGAVVLRDAVEAIWRTRRSAGGTLQTA